MSDLVGNPKDRFSHVMAHFVFAGICLGLQCAVAEFARNELKMPDANSTEFVPDTKYPVVIVYFILDSARVNGDDITLLSDNYCRFGNVREN